MLRERMEEGQVHGLEDEETIDQLLKMRYEHNSRGQIKRETKADAKKRGVKSPDRAEALIMSCAGPASPPLRCY